MDVLGKDRAKRLAKLHQGKFRRQEGLMLLDSLPLIDEGLKHGLVRELFVVPKERSALMERARALGITVTALADGQLDRLGEVKNGPGAVALARLPGMSSLHDGTFDVASRSFLVYMDHIADPGNLGTMARTAAAFGCDGILLSPDCADPFSPKSLRASAGVLLRMELAWGIPEPGPPWPRFFRATARGGFGLEALPTTPDRCALWLGNEAHGPRPAPPELDVQDITIAMKSDVESLNVTAAAAILCHALRSSAVHP